jgi:hypothetical protein
MKNSKLLLAVTFLLAFSGCAVIDKIETSPMTSELITNQLTLRLISGADDPVARAARIREKVALIQSGLGTEYTFVELESKVRENINWQKYSLADQELLNFAITKAGDTISNLIGEGVIDPTDRASVDTLLKWVDQAAERVK